MTHFNTFILAALATAGLSQATTAQTAQDACAVFLTNAEKAACSYGWSAAPRPGSSGSDGAIVAALTEYSPQKGGAIIIPSRSPGSAGYEIIGFPGAEGFGFINSDAMQKLIAPYVVDSTLNAAIAGSPSFTGATEEGVKPFRLGLEGTQIKSVDYFDGGTATFGAEIDAQNLDLMNLLNIEKR